jgi:hypothetical protein
MPDDRRHGPSLKEPRRSGLPLCHDRPRTPCIRNTGNGDRTMTDYIIFPAIFLLAIFVGFRIGR